MKIQIRLIIGLFVCAGMQSFALSDQILLESSVGENYVIEVHPEDSFHEVLDLIDQSLGVIESQSMESQGIAKSGYFASANPRGFRMQVLNDGEIVAKSIIKKQTSSPFRNYQTPMTESEKKDVAYIVKTLANESLIKIKHQESSLKKAGDRVDHVHPFHFLFCVFSNEELKVGIRNIQGRSWVGKSFMEGLTSSINEENDKDNILPHAKSFASRLNIDSNLIVPILKAKQWDKFVDTLIKIIPRTGDTDRYDM